MQYTWRPTLRKYIEDRYIQNPKEWYDLTISTSGLLNITIVSERFAHILGSQRREQIMSLLHEVNAPTSVGFLLLYTITEADSIGLARPLPIQESRADNWSDLAQQAMNASGSPKVQHRKQRIPRRQMKMVEAWAAIHEDELRANWQLLSEGEAAFKVEPLK